MIDIQSDVGNSPFDIEAVGVVGLRYPIKARDAATGAVQATTAEWKMSVALPAARRGTHMSRFVAELEAAADRPFDLDEHHRFARHIVERLNAETADLSTTFTWFRSVKAPVSGRASRLESHITFASTVASDASKTEKALTIAVAAKSLCPCSKAISDRGAHNQRSDISLELGFAADAKVPGFEDVIAMMEESASSRIYPLLKREDEKYITEYAYDHPVFVEDLVRNVATRAHDLPTIRRFLVEGINRESIHAHDCFARVRYQRPL